MAKSQKRSKALQKVVHSSPGRPNHSRYTNHPSKYSAPKMTGIRDSSAAIQGKNQAGHSSSCLPSRERLKNNTHAQLAKAKARCSSSCPPPRASCCHHDTDESPLACVRGRRMDQQHSGRASDNTTHTYNPLNTKKKRKQGYLGGAFCPQQTERQLIFLLGGGG